MSQTLAGLLELLVILLSIPAVQLNLLTVHTHLLHNEKARNITPTTTTKPQKGGRSHSLTASTRTSRPRPRTSAAFIRLLLHTCWSPSTRPLFTSAVAPSPRSTFDFRFFTVSDDMSGWRRMKGEARGLKEMWALWRTSRRAANVSI